MIGTVRTFRVSCPGSVRSGWGLFYVFLFGYDRLYFFWKRTLFFRTFGDDLRFFVNCERGFYGSICGIVPIFGSIATFDKIDVRCVLFCRFFGTFGIVVVNYAWFCRAYVSVTFVTVRSMHVTAKRAYSGIATSFARCRRFAADRMFATVITGTFRGNDGATIACNRAFANRAISMKYAENYAVRNGIASGGVFVDFGSKFLQ